jgi:hypothetical protein
MITVHLPVDLAHEFDADAVITVQATTCAEMLTCLDKMYPGMASWLASADGRFRQNLGVFISGRRLAPSSSLSTPVDAGSEVWLLRAISGG